jgi:pSer/pThr/pTyr-binding forkhead associated (FHA) protein
MVQHVHAAAPVRRGFILVHAPHRPELLVLEGDELVIGRDPSADLVLDHPLVSGFHARVLVGRQNVTVEDLESRNCTLVDGRPTPQAVLQDGATLRIGPWSLEFVADIVADRMNLDRRLATLPRRAVRPRQQGDAALEELPSGTFVADVETLRRLARQDRVRSRARLIPEGGGPSAVVGADLLRIGQRGDVPARGWFCGNVAAELRWDGRQHTVNRRAWLASLRVNGRRCSSRRLVHGDRVVVGQTAYRYLVR